MRENLCKGYMKELAFAILYEKLMYSAYDTTWFLCFTSSSKDLVLSFTLQKT